MNLSNKIKSQFLFALYSRGKQEFVTEKKFLVSLLTSFLTNKDHSKNTKNKIENLAHYFQLKFAQEESWAYCFRENILVNVNMSLERYHEEINKHWSINGAHRPDKSLEAILTV